MHIRLRCHGSDQGRYGWWLIGLMVLVLMARPIHANASQAALVLTAKGGTLSAAPALQILEDPSQQLTLPQLFEPVMADRFVANSTATPSFGRSASAFWVRFTLIDQSDLQWYIFSDSLLGADYDLYLVSGQQVVTAQYAQKLAWYRRPAWALHLPAKQAIQVYIRATNGNSAFNLPVELVESSVFLERSSLNYRLYASIYAAGLVLALYNLFLFFTVRDKSYLFLVVHILAIVMIAHISNPVSTTLSQLQKTDSYFFTAPFYVATVSFFLLTRQLLQTQARLPRLDTILLGGSWLGVLLIPITGWLPSPTLVANNVSAIAILILFGVSAVAARKGDWIARYFFGIFLLVMLFVLPNVLTLVFRVKAWNLNAFYVTFMPLGHIIFSLLLSMVQTQRVRQMREAMHRAEAASQAKSSFLAVMSHELRTPINAITGLGTLLRLTSLNPQQQDYVDKLDYSSQHISRLVGNVLDMAKIESQSFQLDNKLFQLRTIIRHLHDLLADKAQQKGLQLRFEESGEITETLLGDRVRLMQVLVNLLTNAIKYTSTGQVQLAVKKVSSPDPAWVGVYFEVSDTGMGIPADKLAHIFEAFCQLETTPSTTREGVGLGLTICQRLVGLMGGRLLVESVPGKGSRFFFTLCLQQVQAHEQAVSPKVFATRLPENMRILLVDDDDINRFVGQKLLQQLGAQVVLAIDGQSTLMQLRQQTFDLVLLDLSMPDMSGFEVLHWIRHQATNPHVVVIVLTAHATSEAEQLSLQAGADAFMTKPFNYQDLLALIQRLHLYPVQSRKSVCV